MKISCESQNHRFVSNKYVPQALYHMLVKQLASFQENRLYLLRILFEIGFFPLIACLIVILNSHIKLLFVIPD